MKKIISLVCVIIMIFNCIIIAQGAEDEENAIKLTIGEREIVKFENGVETVMETDVAPIIKDGRTFVPVRFISENFGYGVAWDEETQTVMITEDNKTASDESEYNEIESDIEERYIREEENIVTEFMRCTRTTLLKLNNKYMAIKSLSNDEYYYKEAFAKKMEGLGFKQSKDVDKRNEGLRYISVYTFEKEDIKLTYMIEKCIGGEDGYVDASIYIEFFIEIKK